MIGLLYFVKNLEGGFDVGQDPHNLCLIWET